MRTSGNTGQTLLVEDDLALILNAALGLAGEAGEFIDHVKKHIFHGHKLDKSFLIKELGDFLWYCAQAAQGLNTTLSHVADVNIDKLQKRYPAGFSTEASLNRSELYAYAYSTKCGRVK